MKAVNYDVYRFDGQRPEETVLGIFRRHKIALLRSFILGALVLITTVFLMYKLQHLRLVGVIILILTAAFLGREVFRWYFTTYIVTNQRLRFIQQAGLFSQKVLDLDFHTITHVGLVKKGLIAEICKFVNINIQAAAGKLDLAMVGEGEMMYNLLQDQIRQSQQS